MGTVIDVASAINCETRVNEAVTQGAKLSPARPARRAYAPTVIDHVHPEMNVVKTETFGPVSPVIRFRDIDDALRIANGTAYGLSSSVCPTGSTTSRVSCPNCRSAA
jgi:aldehyde dehydrogenase (NAD+)